MTQGYSNPNDQTTPQARFVAPRSGPLGPPQSGPYPRNPVRPEQLIRKPGAELPKPPLQRLLYLWNSDPAYKVLLIAVATIIVSGIVGIILISTWLTGSAASTAPSATTSGTINSKNGSNPGSSGSGNLAVLPTPTPMPTAIPTPVPTAVPTPVPTPVPLPTATPVPVLPIGLLSVQVLNAPDQVANNSTVTLNVQATQPNVTVSLLVTYNAIPGFYNGPKQMTDVNGNATLTWKVKVQSFSKRTAVMARVTVVAQGQNGQIVNSQAVNVQISTN